MLQPRKQKYRKQFRGSRPGNANRGNSLSFGEYGLKSLGRDWITARQIEAARRAIVHFTKRGGKTWIRIFPDKPITKKPAGARMGSGKGDIDTYVAVVKPGRVLFEIAGVPQEEAIEALKRAGHKMPIKTKVISRE
jgi:large subunit ribosomal protein L16